MVAGHDEITSGVVHFQVPLTTPTRGKSATDENVNTGAGYGYLGIAAQGPDDCFSPVFKLARFGIPALIQVNTDDPVVYEDESDSG